MSIVQPAAINLGTVTAPPQPPSLDSAAINLQLRVNQSFRREGEWGGGGGRRVPRDCLHVAARLSWLQMKRPSFRSVLFDVFDIYIWIIHYWPPDIIRINKGIKNPYRKISVS